MKKAVYFTFGLALLVSGFLAGRFFAVEKGDTSVSGVSDLVVVPTGESGPENAPPTLLGESAAVKRVIDGDTIELADGNRVRYIGIETPELVHPKKPVECFAREAAARNREIVQGKMVRLERDISDRDRYGRLLRYVWVGDEMINLKLVEEGYASAATFPPDVKYADKFVSAEQEARSVKRGLWGVCK